MNSSVLWIFLIAAWLFILLPMVLRGRPQARTTDAVRNTRLLHRGGETTARRRVAGRHPSDPDYVRTPRTAAKPAAAKTAAATTAAAKTAAAKTAAATTGAAKNSGGTSVSVQRVVIEETVVVTRNLSGETPSDHAVADDSVADHSAADQSRAGASSAEATAAAATAVGETAVVDGAVVDGAVVDGAVVDSSVPDGEATDVLEPVADESGEGLAADEAAAPHADVATGDATAADPADAATEVIEVIADDTADATDESENGEYESGEYESGEYEYEDEDFEAEDLADESDLEDPADEPAPRTVPRALRGRGGVTREVVDAREARRYRERRLTAGALATLLAASIVACFFWQPYGYLATATVLVLTGLYLFFLRRTAVAEQRFRTQRAARLQRHATQDERLRRAEAEQLPITRPVAPGRRRPGGLVVLDFDDEDPAFDHLPTYDYAGAVGGAPVEDEYRRAV